MLSMICMKIINTSWFTESQHIGSKISTAFSKSIDLNYYSALSKGCHNQFTNDNLQI